LKYDNGSTIIIVAMTAISPWIIDAQMNLEAHFPRVCAMCPNLGDAVGYLSDVPNR